MFDFWNGLFAWFTEYQIYNNWKWFVLRWKRKIAGATPGFDWLNGDVYLIEQPYRLKQKRLIWFKQVFRPVYFVVSVLSVLIFYIILLISFKFLLVQFLLQVRK